MCRSRFVLQWGNGTQVVPYNNFTNYDAIICKRERNILLDFRSSVKYNVGMFDLHLGGGQFEYKSDRKQI